MLGESTFFKQVYELVKTIPHGCVVSYGQVASALGNPRGARSVGWALHLLDGGNNEVPWWRVVNNEGRISIRGNFEATAELQKQLLINEGIEINQEMKFDIEKYRFRF